MGTSQSNPRFRSQNRRKGYSFSKPLGLVRGKLHPRRQCESVHAAASGWSFHVSDVVVSKLHGELGFATVGGRIGDLASVSRRGVAGASPVAAKERHVRPVKPLKAEKRDWWFWLAMAAAWLSGAVLLFVWMMREGASDAAIVSDSEKQEVTYGSVIKLQHVSTNFRLHSHDVPYGSGSGQQSVTAFPYVNDANSYWIVKPAFKSNANQGDTIPNGSIIRLQHMRTQKWLHSHLHQSPLTGNLEVSAFGGPDTSDTGDDWRLEIEGKGKGWTKDQKVRLYHVDTGSYLHTHDKKYMRIVAGQQEVCGIPKKNSDNLWLAAEGIYLPKRAVV